MKVLLIRFSSLGDVILVSSVLPALKEKRIKVDLLTFKPFGELFKGHPFLNKVIEVERKDLKTLKGIKALSEELQEYDSAFDLHDTLRTKILRRYLNFPVFTYKKKSFLRRLMVIFKPFKAKGLFVPELYAEVFRNIGVEIKKPRPYLKVDEVALKKLKSLLGESKNLIAVAPGARWESKTYPLGKFKEIVKNLRKLGFAPVIVGGKEERSKGEILKREGAVNFCGELSLKESLALISICRGVVSNDSAVVHMARAVKTPVVSIFGPTHPSFGFAPYPDEGKALTLNLPCSPCSLHGKTKCKNRKCFEIPPERVVEELLTVIK
ncbi:ADP-heptose:LPS heptosyltransferase [Thermovibrio guaymasensis]|uniref:ADP-heptose:LPS heptosyltransferase n=1 Tax=Thermovibrio guaymasensis TaxID=240167 RepID=A0A420W7U2_9BACT|nr:glycosyltransferase family 9 protein [Thermovibrio guaymasensis]RKQ63376.1 ADP-heptose:LPS heptosyltransferase [Thermovibrio guaymasensis]